MAGAVSACLVEKEARARLRDRSLQDYRSRLNPLKNTYGPRQLQSISRLESPGYEGRSLSMLCRVAKVLHGRVRVTIEAQPA